MAHTEAPASVTYTLNTPNGFNVLFTLRANSGPELLELMTEVEGHFQSEGFNAEGKPGVSKSGFKTGFKTGEATPKQKAVLQDWGLWEEGMSKTEASNIIGQRMDK